MTAARSLPPPGFDALSAEDKLDYVQSLWERVAARPEEVPVPGWHREVLAERLKEFRARTAASGRSWSEFRKELQELLNTPKP